MEVETAAGNEGLTPNDAINPSIEPPLSPRPPKEITLPVEAPTATAHKAATSSTPASIAPIVGDGTHLNPLDPPPPPESASRAHGTPLATTARTHKTTNNLNDCSSHQQPTPKRLRSPSPTRDRSQARDPPPLGTRSTHVVEDNNPSPSIPRASTICDAFDEEDLISFIEPEAILDDAVNNTLHHVASIEGEPASLIERTLVVAYSFEHASFTSTLIRTSLNAMMARARARDPHANINDINLTPHTPITLNKIRMCTLIFTFPTSALAADCSTPSDLIIPTNSDTPITLRILPHTAERETYQQVISDTSRIKLIARNLPPGWNFDRLRQFLTTDILTGFTAPLLSDLLDITWQFSYLGSANRSIIASPVFSIASPEPASFPTRHEIDPSFKELLITLSIQKCAVCKRNHLTAVHDSFAQLRPPNIRPRHPSTTIA